MPSVFAVSRAQGGARADTFNANFLANGGFGEVTNVPTEKIRNIIVTYSLGVNDGYPGGQTSSQMFQSYTNAIYPWAAYGARVRFADTFQVGTNAISAFITYSTSVETNIYNAGLMVRTNINVPISQYVPLRDAITQAFINTNGIFSVDGIHLNNRTNSLALQMIADLIANPVNGSITNTAIGPP